MFIMAFINLNKDSSMSHSTLLIVIFIIIGNTCSNQSRQNSTEYEENGTFQANKFKLEEEFTISTFNGEEFFGYIYNAFETVDSTIFVGDLSNRKIQMFNYDGSYKGYLGGLGSGPGEFRRISNITLLAPDLVLVVDITLGRVTFYNIQNEKWKLHETNNIPINSDLNSETDIYNFRKYIEVQNGYIGVYESTISTFDLNNDNFIRICFVMHDENFNKIETVNPACYEKLELIVNQRSGSSVETVSAMPVPLGHQTLYAVNEEGNLITTWTGEKTIDIKSFNSSSTNKFEYESAKILVSENLVREIVQERIPNESESVFSKEQLTNKIPSYKEFAEQMIIDDKNQLWILSRSSKDNLEWQLYDMNGNIKGKSSHPGGKLIQIKNNRAYFVSNEGEPSFSVFKIE